MRDNRDMFYSDFQTGGFVNPVNMNPQIMGNNMMPNAFAYGVQGFNTNPGNKIDPMIYPQNNLYYDNSNYMDNRVLKLERQVKRLESRVTRLENLSGNSLDDITTTDNLYMI